MAAALAAALLAIVLTGLPGVTGVVRQIWSGLSAISALIAVIVAFDGYIASPVLLAMAVVVAIAGRRDEIARWAAIGFGVVGGGIYLSYAPPSALAEATETTAARAFPRWSRASCWSHARSRSRGRGSSAGRGAVIWAGSAAVIVYAVTVVHRDRRRADRR